MSFSRNLTDFVADMRTSSPAEQILAPTCLRSTKRTLALTRISIVLIGCGETRTGRARLVLNKHSRRAVTVDLATGS